MKIWVDADACPTACRDLILRAAKRLCLPVVFVANKALMLPEYELFQFVQVESDPDAADDYIAGQAVKGDLTVTQDVPLAARLVAEGVCVLSPRGDEFNEENIGDRLSKRDLLQELRDIGEISGGPRPFDEKAKRRFANALDASLHKLKKAIGQ